MNEINSILKLDAGGQNCKEPAGSQIWFVVELLPLFQKGAIGGFL
jgi:hypothetical protein